LLEMVSPCDGANATTLVLLAICKDNVVYHAAYINRVMRVPPRGVLRATHITIRPYVYNI
jgi:hypothetical protein